MAATEGTRNQYANAARQLVRVLGPLPVEAIRASGQLDPSTAEDLDGAVARYLSASARLFAASRLDDLPTAWASIAGDMRTVQHLSAMSGEKYRFREKAFTSRADSSEIASGDYEADMAHVIEAANPRGGFASVFFMADANGSSSDDSPLGKVTAAINKVAEDGWKTLDTGLQVKIATVTGTSLAAGLVPLLGDGAAEAIGNIVDSLGGAVNTIKRHVVGIVVAVLDKLKTLFGDESVDGVLDKIKKFINGDNFLKPFYLFAAGEAEITGLAKQKVPTTADPSGLATTIEGIADSNHTIQKWMGWSLKGLGYATGILKLWTPWGAVVQDSVLFGVVISSVFVMADHLDSPVMGDFGLVTGIRLTLQSA